MDLLLENICARHLYRSIRTRELLDRKVPSRNSSDMVKELGSSPAVSFLKPRSLSFLALAWKSLEELLMDATVTVGAPEEEVAAEARQGNN